MSPCLTLILPPADEGPQLVPHDPAASAPEQASPTADQPASDTVAATEDVQNTVTDSTPAESTGFEAVEQSSTLQRPARDVPQQTQVLHVCLGPLPDIHSSCKAFYFMREQPGTLTLEDMDTQVDCGVLSEGPSLKMLQQVPLFAADSQHDAACFMFDKICLISELQHHRSLQLQVLSSVFVPLLAQQAVGDKHAAMMGSGDDRGQSSLLNEFLADLNKFVGQVGQTMHELQGTQMLVHFMPCGKRLSHRNAFTV